MHCKQLILSQEIYQTAIPIYLLRQSDLVGWLETQDSLTRQWVKSIHYQAKEGEVALIADAEGKLKYVLLGYGKHTDFWNIGRLPKKLPPGNYRIEGKTLHSLRDIALVWALGCYQFGRYKKSKMIKSRLVMPDDFKLAHLQEEIEATYLVRDLINTPAEDMGSVQLAESVCQVAEQHQAKVKQIIGEELCSENYPAIYHVGRAGGDAPRLIDLKWGQSTHPKLVLIGKGVCFDSGGLQLKSPAGLLGMKKDMGGAAHALALAKLIMAYRLPVQLRVLIPAVENAISEKAYKPGDILATRKNINVEIVNTDAEGRLILADALAEACSWKPTMIIDFATLTGAARIALGPDLPALFSNRDQLATEIMKCGIQEHDPLWHMPLYKPYRKFLRSNIADIVNASSNRGGSITAALFLQSFVNDSIDWVHIDLMGFYIRNLPGRSKGGAAMGLRAMYHYLKNRYAPS